MSHAKDCSDIARAYIQSKVDNALSYITIKTKELAEVGDFMFVFSVENELGISPDSYSVIAKLADTLGSANYDYQVALLTGVGEQVGAIDEPTKIKVSWGHF